MNPIILPAITLWQPWATLVALGVKPYETRPRAPYKNLLGKRVAIHASMRKCRHTDYEDAAFDAISDVFGRTDWMKTLPLGAVVCTAIITEAYPADQVVPADHFGDYGPGRWAWKLDDVVTFEPVPAKGQQLWGWPWEVPPSLRFKTWAAA